LKVLQKLAKQRRESSEIYREQDRPDLEKTELEELEVIEEYLPRQITPDELESVLQSIISETGASSMKDMGKEIGRENVRTTVTNAQLVTSLLLETKNYL